MTNQGRNAIDTLLAESLKELTIKQPIEKITIKEITDKAGVIRPTFYNHFQDKYELLEWIIRTELLEPVKPLIQNGMINQALIIIFAGIEKEKDFYTKASRLEGQNSFEDIVKECITGTLIEVLEEKDLDKKIPSPWLTKGRIARYHAQSLCFLVITWIKSGMSMPAKEMSDIYNYMIRNSIADIIGDN